MRKTFGTIALLLALLATSCSAYADSGTTPTVTITQRGPIETISSTGVMVGVREATIGTKLAFVSSDGSKLTLRDAQGTLYRIAQSATDYTAGQQSSTTPRPETTSGPAPFQEVDATGQGTSEDDAFKQAVNDAVRQVVGTLVSAENVINNDRVIKDEVLTLSNGFVEKVLSQDKTKLDDGTWQVKLKCIVRKGQLYGRLQEVKVPTVKFEGASLFADVVSQQSAEKDAAAMLAEAILGWNGSCYKAVSLSTKPDIIDQNQESVRIRMPCRVTLERSIYEKQFLGKLKNLLETIAIGKPVETSSTIMAKGMSGMTPGQWYQYEQEWRNRAEENIHWLKHNHVTEINLDGVPHSYLIKTSVVEIAGGRGIFLDDETSEREVQAHLLVDENPVQLTIFAAFFDSAGECLLIRKLGSMNTATRIRFFSDPPRLDFPNPYSINISPEIIVSSDSQDFQATTTIPVKYLSQISKIELHVSSELNYPMILKQLPAEAPGGFVFLPSENRPDGLLFFAKPNEKRDVFRKVDGDDICYLDVSFGWTKLVSRGCDCFYLPTLEIPNGQPLESSGSMQPAAPNP